MKTAGPRKLNDSFRTLKFPVHCIMDWDTRKWNIVDKLDVIVAENLTKKDAQTTRDALNYIGKSLELLIGVLDAESNVIPNPDIPLAAIYDRTNLLRAIFEFLISAGIIERPILDHKKVFRVWAEELIHSPINAKKKEGPPPWVNYYHKLKDEGYFNEINK